MSRRFPLLIVLSMTGFFTLMVLAQPPVAIDESAWITSSQVTYQLVRHAKPPSEWAAAYDRFSLGDWGNKNPPIGKLYIGTVLALTGHGDPKSYRWIWPLSYQENVARGALAPMSILTPARLAIALSAGLTLWFLYLIAFELTGSPVAIVAPIVLFLLPVFRFHATRVYMDMPQLAFLAASGYALMRSRFMMAAAFAGLACAVKFNAAPMVLAIGLIALYKSQRRLRDALLVGIVAFAVFVAVNPYLYQAPISRSLGIVSSWNVSKAEQKTDPAIEPYAVTSRAHALGLTLSSILRPDAVQASFFGTAQGLGLLMMFGTLAGGVLAFRRQFLPWLVMASAFVFFTVAWLPMDWGRYYLPVILWTSPLFIAVTTSEAYQWPGWQRSFSRVQDFMSGGSWPAYWARLRGRG